MNWFDDQKFWALFYDWMFPDISFRQAQAQIDDLVQLTGLRQGALLDLCCGPGRYSVPLARRGFTVTGVDLQPMLLDKARDYRDRENVSIDFIEANMRNFRRPNAFDLVISMFSSFGYFRDPTDDVKVLENVYVSLKYGGKLLMDLRGKEIHAMANVTHFSQEMPNGDLIFHRTCVNDDWTQTQSEWIYVQGDRAHRFPMTINLYSGAELRGLLQQVGFSTVRIYGNLKGGPYNQTAERLIVLAEKN